MTNRQYRVSPIKLHSTIFYLLKKGLITSLLLLLLDVITQKKSKVTQLKTTTRTNERGERFLANID